MIQNRNDDTPSGTIKEPWLAYLEGEIASCGEDSYNAEFATIMRSLLLSLENSAPADTARRIDTYYWEEYLPSDPLLRFQDDKGIGGFLNFLYELVFDMARLVPYDDSKQDQLLQLIFELRQLPPKPFKIWNVRCPPVSL